MAAWASLQSAVESALTSAGYTVPADGEPSRWPSWSVGASGAARWVSVLVEQAEASASGVSDTTRHALTVRTLCGGPWSRSVSQAAALDAARAIRAALETPSGLVSGTAHPIYVSSVTESLGACYLVTLTFTVVQLDEY